MTKEKILILKELRDEIHRIEKLVDELNTLEGGNLHTTEKEITTRGEKKEMEDIFHQMQIFPHYAGYKYLKEAIYIGVEDQTAVEAPTKEIYPTVASRFHVTASSVERNIRTVINRAWTEGGFGDRCPIKNLNLGRKPTTSEFIALVADYIARN